MLFRSTWFAVMMCDAAMMSLAIAVNLLPVFLPTLADALGDGSALTKEQLGRIGAVTFSGLVIGILVTGPAADRFGARAFAVGGNALIAIGLAMLSAAPSYAMVLAASFVMGLGAGALDMVLSPIVSALQPHRRTVAMNLLHAFYCIGAVVTILLSVAAIQAGFTWRHAAIWLLPAPVIIGGVFLLLHLPPMVADNASPTPMRVLIRQRFFQLLMIAIFLGGATELGMAYWLPTYAELTLGTSARTAGLAFVGFSLAMAVGRLGVGLLPHSVGPIALMLACCAASVVLFLLASFSPSTNVALASCVLAGLAGSCLWPSTLAVGADRYPTGGATMFAVLAALGNFGGIVMPWVVGVVADRSDLRWGLSTGALCPALMIVTLLWMKRCRAEVHE